VIVFPCRINSLEHACQEKDKQLTEEREKFHKLKEDFKYNLKLLEQRDQELDRYDATFSGMIILIYVNYIIKISHQTIRPEL
jgi:hypothetical protein